MGRGQVNPSDFSAAEYGARRGSARILGLLSRAHLRSTFFIPGVIAQLYPDEIDGIASLGHEVAMHGWEHERATQLDDCKEAELFERSYDALTKVTGRPPMGTRAPSFDASPRTARLIRAFGLMYDSSLMADDEPYELLEDGQPTGVVEIPVDWSRDDATALVMDRWGGLRPEVAVREIFANWRTEFLVARQEGGLFQLTLHPDLIGRRVPMYHLEEFVDFLQSYDRVWFATHEEIARICAKQLVEGE